MTSEMPLRPGEPVTIVRQNSVVLTTVETSMLTGFTVLDMGGTFYLATHDVTWLHGHHLFDSESVRAARAAIALLTENPPATGATGVGGIVGATGVVGYTTPPAQIPPLPPGVPWPHSPKE